jgi:hypothetical protein
LCAVLQEEARARAEAQSRAQEEQRRKQEELKKKQEEAQWARAEAAEAARRKQVGGRHMRQGGTVCEGFNCPRRLQVTHSVQRQVAGTCRMFWLPNWCLEGSLSSEGPCLHALLDGM